MAPTVTYGHRIHMLCRFYFDFDLLIPESWRMVTELLWMLLSGHRKILATSFERKERIEREHTVLFTRLKKKKKNRSGQRETLRKELGRKCTLST